MSQWRICSTAATCTGTGGVVSQTLELKIARLYLGEILGKMNIVGCPLQLMTSC